MINSHSLSRLNSNLSGNILELYLIVGSHTFCLCEVTLDCIDNTHTM